MVVFIFKVFNNNSKSLTSCLRVSWQHTCVFHAILLNILFHLFVKCSLIFWMCFWFSFKSLTISLSLLITGVSVKHLPCNRGFDVKERSHMLLMVYHLRCIHFFNTVDISSKSNVTLNTTLIKHFFTSWTIRSKNRPHQRPAGGLNAKFIFRSAS